MVTRAVAWVSHGKLLVLFLTFQVSGLRHDLPLRILTSHLLPDAFPLEEKSKFVMFSICTVLNKGHGASLGYLALITIGGTVFVFGLNYAYKSAPDQMLPDVGFGQTTWTYHLGLYFAPWNRFQHIW